MGLFPIRRPTVGIDISARALTLVEVSREWRKAGRGWRLRQCTRQEVSEGVLNPSATEPNIANLTIMTSHLRGLLKDHMGSCVAVSLPDQCARLALFDFETLPHKATEVEALLRFRFQKDLGIPLGDARITYRVFRPKSDANRTVRVLVAAVRQEIVGQYEQLCEQVGVVPVAVGLSSFLLFDACTAAMTTSARDALFLHVGEQSLAFLAFQQGCPIFLRVKSLPHHVLQMPDGQVGDGGAENTGSAKEAPIIQEILATLHYYADRYLGQPDEGGPRPCPLYLVKAYGDYRNGRQDTNGEDDPLGPAAGEVLSAALTDQVQLKLMMLDWNVLRVSNGSTRGPLARSGLSAIAAMLAA